jgi:prepilin-type N-terminal cleavage/methylation domain-containing protein/prepilin-type processing-associated H-X9-DG protein
MDIRRKRGFTLVELLVVIGIIAILMSMLMPALSRAKQKANRVNCLNNIRQVSMSAGMYAGDHDGEYPRRLSLTNSWIFQLEPYYKTKKVLKCPADKWTEWRSFLINGFNDFWNEKLPAEEYRRVMNWEFEHGMKESDIKLPSETVLFGEKKIGSFHVHMDFGQKEGNDKQEVNHNMHKSGAGATSGGSNFSFVDGSSRMLPYMGSVRPVNLWAVTEIWRGAPVEIQE